MLYVIFNPGVRLCFHNWYEPTGEPVWASRAFVFKSESEANIAVARINSRVNAEVVSIDPNNVRQCILDLVSPKDDKYITE